MRRLAPTSPPGWRVSLVLLLCACGGGPSGDGISRARPPFAPGPVPPEHAQGAELFLANCTGCHGSAGSGFSGGPPLLDSLYLPDRFADSAIARAILAGAPRRHWGFDDMPAVRTVQPHEVPAIVGYIRWVQDRWASARDLTAPDSVTPVGGG